MKGAELFDWLHKLNQKQTNSNFYRQKYAFLERFRVKKSPNTEVDSSSKLVKSQGRLLCLDCEMVKCWRTKPAHRGPPSPGIPVLAQVSLIQMEKCSESGNETLDISKCHNFKVLLKSFVRIPEEYTVIDYIPEITGINSGDLENSMAVDKEAIIERLTELVQPDDFIFGHSLDHDFSVLEFFHQNFIDSAQVIRIYERESITLSLRDCVEHTLSGQVFRDLKPHNLSLWTEETRNSATDFADVRKIHDSAEDAKWSFLMVLAVAQVDYLLRTLAPTDKVRKVLQEHFLLPKQESEHSLSLSVAPKVLAQRLVFYPSPGPLDSASTLTEPALVRAVSEIFACKESCQSRFLVCRQRWLYRSRCGDDVLPEKHSLTACTIHFFSLADCLLCFQALQSGSTRLPWMKEKAAVCAEGYFSKFNTRMKLIILEEVPEDAMAQLSKSLQNNSLGEDGFVTINRLKGERVRRNPVRVMSNLETELKHLSTTSVAKADAGKIFGRRGTILQAIEQLSGTSLNPVHSSRRVSFLIKSDEVTKVERAMKLVKEALAQKSFQAR